MYMKSNRDSWYNKHPKDRRLNQQIKSLQSSQRLKVDLSENDEEK